MIAEPSFADAVTARWTVDVDALAPRAWDELVAGFADGSWDQTASWVDARWGAQRSSALVLRRDGRPVAAARTVLFRWPGIRRGIAYVKWGPMCRPRGEPPAPDAYRRCAEALVDEYCTRRGLYLTVLPRVSPVDHDVQCRVLHELGFVVRRPMLDPNRYVVDVTLDPDARLASIAQKWRYNLRRALAGGIECRLAEFEPGLATFATLHARMRARKRYVAAEALHALPALAASLSDSMRPKIVLASRAGMPIAGAVVAVCGDTAYYVFGASDDVALGLKAGYALQWWIVEWLSTLPVRWYDLGGEALDAGLRQFKKGLVGKRGAVVAASGEFDRWTGVGARLAADSIYRLRDMGRALRLRRLRRAGGAALDAPA